MPLEAARCSAFSKSSVRSVPPATTSAFYDTSIGLKLSVMIAYQPTLMVAVLRRANKARQSTGLVACNCLKQGQKAAKIRSILS